MIKYVHKYSITNENNPMIKYVHKYSITNENNPMIKYVHKYADGKKKLFALKKMVKSFKECDEQESTQNP
jgi:sulfur relay (sulfurtransferase) DsrC/TusE family protein